MSKILAVDIGNTLVHLGLFSNKKILFKKVLSSDKVDYLHDFKRLKKILDFDAAVVSSVVPTSTAAVVSALNNIWNKNIFVVGKDIKIPLRNRYQTPKKLGSDRLINAYAAFRLYGAPAIVIDYGSAVTFDLLSKKGEFLGGLILPGLKMSFKALAENTALLPRVHPRLPRGLIGKNTEECIINGVVSAMVIVTEGLVLRLKERLGKKAVVVATGGDVDLMQKSLSCLNVVDRDLALKGLVLLLEDKHRHYSGAEGGS